MKRPSTTPYENLRDEGVLTTTPDIITFDTRLELEEGQLPSLWLSSPMYNEIGHWNLRRVIGRYGADIEDEHGWKALAEGDRAFREALRYKAPEERDRKIACIQLAELLYLHAIAHGSTLAWLNLGRIYDNDYAEGDYFGAAACQSPAKQAFFCYSKAAEYDNAEAMYRLGDLYKAGKGVEKDEVAAFRYYVKAQECDERDSEIWAPIALRLGEAFEHGMGCDVDDKTACAWYAKALLGFKELVLDGYSSYEGALQAAQDGVWRTKL